MYVNKYQDKVRVQRLSQSFGSVFDHFDQFINSKYIN